MILSQNPNSIIFPHSPGNNSRNNRK